MSDTDTDFPDFDISTASFEPDDATDKPVRTRRPRSDKGQPRGTRTAGGSTTAKDKRLAEDLLGPWALIIKALAMPMPTLSAVMAARGEKSTQAIVGLASPKLKEKLAKVSKLGPGSDLVETLAMMLVAVLVDVQKLDPDSPLVMLTGVKEMFDLTHDVQVVPVDGANGFPVSPGMTPFPMGV